MEEEEKTYVTTYSDEYLKDIKKFSKGDKEVFQRRKSTDTC